MIIYLPENLDIEKVVVNYKEKHREKYQWIINSILTNNYKIDNGFNGYVNLNQTILRKYVGEKYCKKILEQLENSGIIEINHSYSVGNYSKSYRLSEAYRSATVTSIDFSSNKALSYLLKLSEYNKEVLATHLSDHTIDQLYKNVRLVDIDNEAASTHISDLLANSTITSEQEAVATMSRETINNKDESHFFTIDEQTGRIYHPIANCPRYLRQFLSYKGKKLVQIDIANSQPMLFVPLISEYLEESKDQNKYVYSNTSSTYSLSNIDSPYVENNVPQKLPDDVVRYKKLCSEGRFYDDLMEEFDIPSSERSAFKKEFFGKIFYSQLHHNWEYDIAKRFKSIYPTVYEAILWHKKNNHADLPIKLQSVESNIVIKGVCTKLVKDNPEETRPFFITIHDSIVCLEEDSQYIKKLMDEELEKHMGFQPKVTVTNF